MTCHRFVLIIFFHKGLLSARMDRFNSKRPIGRGDFLNDIFML